MVRQLKKNCIGIGVLILVLSGCQPGTPTPPFVDIPALTLTSLVQTLTAPPASPTPMVVDGSATLPAEGFPTATEFASTVEPPTAPVNTVAPTLALAPAPSAPMASVTVGTNCRSGPGREYEILGGAQVGVKFVLVGRNTATNYWIILLPDGRECWLWGQHAVVEGNVTSLPEYAIPVPPVPQFGSVQGVIQARDALGAIVTIQGIRVTFQPSGLSTTADSTGNYLLDGVPVGEIRVHFAHPNLIASDITSVIVQAGRRTVVATAIGSYVIPGPPPPTPCRIPGFCVPLPTVGPVQQ